jgi:hypothetical protein
LAWEKSNYAAFRSGSQLHRVMHPFTLGCHDEWLGARVDVTLGIAGTNLGPGAVAEQVRSLFAWLVREDALRGRVRLAEPEPAPGTLGVMPTELLVALVPGGAGTVLASAVIAWIRHRTGEVSCTFTRPDGTSMKVTAERVRGTDIAGLRELVESLATTLDSAEAEGGDGE